MTAFYYYYYLLLWPDVALIIVDKSRVQGKWSKKHPDWCTAVAGGAREGTEITITIFMIVIYINCGRGSTALGDTDCDTSCCLICTNIIDISLGANTTLYTPDRWHLLRSGQIISTPDKWYLLWPKISTMTENIYSGHMITTLTINIYSGQIISTLTKNICSLQIIPTPDK